jgi:hypothetical protein
MFAAGLALAGGGGDDNLASVIAKGDAKCIELWDGFRQLVAEEQDVQRVFDKSGKVRRERRIRSDYYIVRLPSARPDDSRGLLEFRDVLEVDGKLVHRDPIRLRNLLTARGASLLEESCRIQGAANEHNLFGSGWHIAFTAGIAGYVHAAPDSQIRYRLAPELAGSSDELVVCFEETEHAARMGEGPCMKSRPLPGTGCIRLGARDYDILNADVTLALKTMPVQLRAAVEYREGPGGLRVPVRRVISILHPKWRDGLAAQAEATYSNFRRFTAESTIRFEPIR